MAVQSPERSRDGWSPDGPAAGELRLTSLSKAFGSTVAVENLTLTIPEGSFFALLGPSGCGKTTTLRMVAGLENPTSGQVRLGGTEITRLRPYRRPVNTVFQSYALFPHLDVYENVAFGLKRRGVTGSRIKGQVAEMLALVQLAGFERRRPAALSGGQQQRVALARALVNHPRVLLLDEPLGALDLKLRREMQIELKRIQSEVGITFLHVTHDQEEAMWMADTVAVMVDGRVAQLGAPEQIYEFPADDFVANFLGQSNLLTGSITGRSGQDVLVTAHGSRFTSPGTRSRATAGEVWLGVRPEKLQLAVAGEAVPAGHNRIEGVLTEICYAGVSTEYLLRTGWGQELSVFTANAVPGFSPEVGSALVAHWHPSHSFVLARPAGEPVPAAVTGTGSP